MALIFQTLRQGGNNLSYVLGCTQERTAAVVDPASPYALLDWCRGEKLTISLVLNTHGHADHIAGNEVIVNATGATIIAHPAERVAGAIAPRSHLIPLGRLNIEVLPCPGHTAGSLAFKIGSRLISGDTIFLAGTGNTRFGGSVEDLFHSLETQLLPLPDRTTLYPGHDYALVNLRFAQSIEPDNPALERKLKAVRKCQRQNILPSSTLAEEKLYNPFLRCRAPELIQSLQTEFPDLEPDDPLQIFRLLRTLRDNW